MINGRMAVFNAGFWPKPLPNEGPLWIESLLLFFEVKMAAALIGTARVGTHTG
jgi:hypothetical protein